MTIIKNGTLITPEGELCASMAIEDGKITAIGDIAEKEGDEVVDASGCYVYPGFIDGHTHLDLPVCGTVTADDFESGTKGAVCGGTTTVVDFATQYKGDTLLGALETWKEKARDRSRANYAFHMAICDWNEEARAQLPALREAGVTSFKVYMAYDTALTDAQILEVLQEVRKFGGITGCHCENGGLVTELQREQLQMGHFGTDAHPLSRPAEVEAEAVNRFCYLGKLADAPINIVHLSTRLGLEEIRKARKEAEGLDGSFRIYVESCPQYMIFDDSRYSLPDFEGAKYVCSPPLRKKEDMEALKEAVISGEIDTIATDHCSFMFGTQKQVGRDNFTQIPNGAPGIEHRPAVFMNIFGDKLSPADYCRLMSENPARVFGMYPAKGALMVGSDADVTVWDPSVSWTITAAEQHQNVDYTPFEGMEVKGRPRYVFVNGVLAAKDGEPTEATAGRYVRR
ncbi:MAG: dihydropyrimidinase [Lachnospiraceae bacterium]|nr:dihydropyrimidinase [Lachnospiraceae bacterium]